MKAFKIRYEFFNRNNPKNTYWDIGSAVVISEDEYQAAEFFYLGVEDQSSSILDSEELKTKQLIWAY